MCQLILWALRFRVDAPHLKTTHTYQHLTARSPTGQPVFGPNTQTSSHRRPGFGATSDRRFTETTVSQQRLARSHLMPSRKRTGPCPGPEPTAPGGDASGATAAFQMGQPGGPTRTRPQSERSLVVKQGQKTRHELKGGWKSKVQFGGASDSIDSMTVVSGYVSSVQNWFKRKAARGCFSAMAVFLPFHPNHGYPPSCHQPDPPVAPKRCRGPTGRS